MSKLNCASCSNELGLMNKTVIELSVMKAISKIDINTSNGQTKLKCARCNEWNSFVDGSQSIDMQMKSREVLEYKPIYFIPKGTDLTDLKK